MASQTTFNTSTNIMNGNDPKNVSVANYSVEEIERIINDFYSPTSQLTVPQRQQLNSILECLQYSPLAWDFSWTLLNTNKSPSVQFFGAVALCNKISKHLSELDDNEIQLLFQQLIQRLVFYMSINSKQISIKLVVALGHLILNMMPDKWKNGITAIITLFSQSQNEFLKEHPEKGHLIVLNILTILPEEFSRIVVSKAQRASIRGELENQFPVVLNYIQFIISAYNQPDILAKMFSCLSKWLEFGIAIIRVESLFDYLFNSLNNENIFDDASNCIIVLFTSPDVMRYPAIFSRLLPYVLQLESILDQSLMIGDKEKSECITKLITQFGENLAQLIIQMAIAPNQQSQTLSHRFCCLIMKCTDMKGQYPVEETCSELTFSFWYALQEEVTSIDDDEQRIILLELFRPYFERLIEVLISKGQLPENDSSFTSEDKETFRCYRVDITDTMMCMHTVLSNRAMEVLANHLSLAVEQNQSWQRQESIIQLVGAGSEYVPLDENQILPRIFLLLPKLNFCNSSIINATLMVLGQYSSWLGHHQETLQNCVHLCINALSNSELIQSASIALKELTMENRMHMSKYLNDIFPIIKNVLENGHVQPNDRIRCVAIIGYILSAYPAKIVIDHLNILLAPEVNKLLGYLSETNGDQNAILRKQNICTTLSFISVLITAIGYCGDQSDGDENEQQQKATENPSEIPEVLCCVLRDLTPILHLVLKQYADDSEVTEKLCEILSRTVTTLRESINPILNTLLELLQNIGPNILHAQFLNFVRNTLLLFSQDTDKQMFNLFLAVLQRFGCLFNGDIQWLKNHVDIVEDFANFLIQIIKKLPAVVHHCPNEAFVLLFQFVKTGLQLHEQATLRSITMFTSNYIEYTKSNQRAADLLKQNGLEIVQILLKCIGGASPRHLVDTLSLPLLTLTKFYIDSTVNWVQQCLNDPNFPTPSPKRHHREALIKALSSERTSRANFKDHVNTFSSACRGIEYSGTSSNDNIDIGYNLILLSNRDEDFRRPAKQADIWKDTKYALGGQDQTLSREGGTWLCLNTVQSKIGVLLNLTSHLFEGKNINGQSRGFIVPNYVNNPEINLDLYMDELQKVKGNYTGFNFLGIERQLESKKWRAKYINNVSADSLPIEIKTSPFGFSNHIYGDENAFGKTRLGCQLFKTLLHDLTDNYKKTITDEKELIRRAFSLLSDTTIFHNDSNLDCVYSHYTKANRDQISSIHVQTTGEEPTYGTRTSTVLIVRSDQTGVFIEKTLSNPLVDSSEWTENKWHFQLNDINEPPVLIN
ncbi:unnamed protein product [Rotaria magnacalcarata]|uniref:Importin-13 n=1 Tax=Rotaria magnacalcarata TaxID=392030 RepID=A0A814T6G4_9BILA|nr:unnamed protein product [Rotaria magnacalcarata]